MYAANTSDKKRMRMVLDAVPPVDVASERGLQPALGASQEGGGGNADGVDMSLANIVQTCDRVEPAIFLMWERNRHVFPVNPENVPTCNRQSCSCL